MKRTMLVIALVLLASSARAQLYMAQASESQNTGSTTSHTYCTPVQIVSGRGSVAIADGVVTPVPQNGTQLDGVQEIQSVHATDPYNRAGFAVWIGGRMQVYGITSRTTPPHTTLTLRNGSISGTNLNTLPTLAPLTPGTYDRWAYWNYTCQRNTSVTPVNNVWAQVHSMPLLGAMSFWTFSHYRSGAISPAGKLFCKPNIRGNYVGTEVSSTGTMNVTDGTVPGMKWSSILGTGTQRPFFPDLMCTVEMTGKTTDVESSFGFFIRQ